MDSPVLELQNVTVQFDDKPILENVSLKVFPGETIVLVGQSGAGKTVLLKTMAGVYEPIRGKVLCHGHSWSSLDVIGKHELAKTVGMQFQKSALFDDLTAFENVAFPMREHGENSEEHIKQKVTASLKSLNLEKASHLYPHEMSGGMRQRLGIARAIVLKPEILFMDDPTAGLDPLNSDQTAELILNLKQQIGCTLIIITHDMLRAYQMAGRIILVADRTIIEAGSAEQTQNHSDPRVQQFIHGLLTGPLKLI